MAMDLRRFFQSDGAEETVRQGLDFSGVELGGVKPFCAPVEVKARLKGFAGSVELQRGLQGPVPPMRQKLERGTLRLL